jgi:hypothetical protein
MSKKFFVLIAFAIFLSSCCGFFGMPPCPPKENEEGILDDSNPYVRLISISNNSCKACSGSGNWSVDYVLENKSSKKITVDYSYLLLLIQPDGHTANFPTNKTSILDPKARLSVECMCKIFKSPGDNVVQNFNITSANELP